jgi:hypothetical protein
MAATPSPPARASRRARPDAFTAARATRALAWIKDRTRAGRDHRLEESAARVTFGSS